MVKVYFGPKRHAPVDELPRDERFLWLRDFHLLRGVDQDFWTNNALVLDSFERQQIQLWTPGGWQPLSLLADEFLPGWAEKTKLAGMSNAQLAMLVEMAYEQMTHLGELEAAQAQGEQKTQP